MHYLMMDDKVTLRLCHASALQTRRTEYSQSTYNGRFITPFQSSNPELRFSIKPGQDDNSTGTEKNIYKKLAFSLTRVFSHLISRVT